MAIIDIYDGNKIIKYANAPNQNVINFLENFINKLIKNPDDNIVDVYEFNRNKNLNYQYIMDWLHPLNQEEKAIVTILSGIQTYRQQHAGIKPKFVGEEKTNIILNAKKNYRSLYDFINEENERKRYFDFHEHNVMKDSFGNYKFIDLEGFVDYEKFRA